MKIILQAFEPQPQPFGGSEAKVQPATPAPRRPRVRLLPVAAESRLFHAL